MIKWSILIATCPPRAVKFKRLMKLLMPQVDAYKGQIEVIVLFNNFEFPSLGHIRQLLLDEAKGEYVNFIDDDDLVPQDYCDTIFPLLDGVDYIGFNVELRNDGKVLRPVYHSLRYKEWSEDEQGYYRGVTHINPIKTELARIGTFPAMNVGEDWEWTKQVQTHLNSGEYTEHYINRPMYIYDHFGLNHLNYDFPLEQNQIVNPKRPKLTKYARFHERSTK